MDTTSIVFKMLEFILYFVLGAILFFYLLFLIIRLIKFNSLIFKPYEIMLGELVKKKYFKTSDGYELNWFGEIKKDSNMIILLIHDIYGDSKNFNEINNYCIKNNPNISIVSFDQRGFGKNVIEKHPNIGATLKDISSIIDFLSEKHPECKIVLAGEGYGAHFALNFVNNEKVYKVIATSLKVKSGYKTSFHNFNFILFGILFSGNIKYVSGFDPDDLTDNPDYSKELDKKLLEYRSISVREYFQLKRVVKKSLNSLKNIKNQNRVTIIQPSKSIYSDKITFKKIFSKIDMEKINLNIIPNQKHYLFNSKHYKSFFSEFLKEF